MTKKHHPLFLGFPHVSGILLENVSPFLLYKTDNSLVVYLVSQKWPSLPIPGIYHNWKCNKQRKKEETHTQTQSRVRARGTKVLV